MGLEPLVRPGPAIAPPVPPQLGPAKLSWARPNIRVTRCKVAVGYQPSDAVE